MNTSKSAHSSLKAVVVALMANFFVTIVKFAGWLITSSPSMLAEALHSLADVMNQCLLFIGIKSSQGKADSNHPYGKGAMQYLFNFMSAIGIFTLGCIVTIYHAVHDYMHPQSVDNKWIWLNLGILIFAFFIEGYSGIVALREIIKQKGKKSLIKFLKNSDDPTLVGIFLEDSAAVLGILFALFGVACSRIFQSNTPDVITAIIIGGMMGLIAVFLGISNARFLIGKSSGVDREEEYKEFIDKLPTVERVFELRSEILGPNKIHLYAKIELHGMLMADPEHMTHEARHVQAGDITAIEALMNAYSRAIRDVGPELQSIEEKTKEKFPEIVQIDFELG